MLIELGRVMTLGVVSWQGSDQGSDPGDPTLVAKIDRAGEDVVPVFMRVAPKPLKAALIGMNMTFFAAGIGLLAWVAG